MTRPRPLVASILSVLLCALASSSLAHSAGSQSARKIKWHLLQPEQSASSGGTTLSLDAEGAIVASGTNPDKDVYTIRCTTNLEGITGIKIEALTDPALKGKGPGRSVSGNFVLTDVALRAEGKMWRKPKDIALHNAAGSYSQTNWPAGHAIDAKPGSGWAIAPRFGEYHSLAIETLEAIRQTGGGEITLEIRLAFQYGKQHSIGRLKLYATTDAEPARPSARSQVSPQLQEKINESIKLGLDYLMDKQSLDGSWSGHQSSYNSGMTALAVYTMLKSGLTEGHPSVKRGLEFLRTHPPRKVYECACQILALVTLNKPEHKDWIAELTAQLGDWKADGGYGYPGGVSDISNTQYGALGLWAAMRYGISIPKSLFEELAEDALLFQQTVTRSSNGGAGFNYRPGAGGYTGSRTSAGLTILSVAREALGDDGMTRDWSRALDQGITWLGANFSGSSNPHGGKSHLNYYLYGVERVAALNGLVHIGGADWYRDGATFLVGSQAADGHWQEGGDVQSNTCFALLFLNRATSPSSGKGSRGQATYGHDDPKGIVSLRASGDAPLTMWVSSFGDAVSTELTWPNERQPRITEVLYVNPGTTLVPDGRTSTALWRFRDRHPREGWALTDFQDGFWTEAPGPVGTPGVRGCAVRTPYDGESIWLRRSFELDPGKCVEPELVLFYSEKASEDALRMRPVYALFDERVGLEQRLKTSSGGGRVTESHESFSGAVALRVDGSVIENANIGGWSFPVRKQPKEGQFRYLQFSWKKPSGKSGIMLQVARDGQMADAARYYAGENAVGFEPAKSLSKKVPREWEVVTCDLYKDFGGDGRVTGISLAAMGEGEAYFDAIYLVRSKKDLRAVTEATRARAVEAAASSSVNVYLNGTLVHSRSEETSGYEHVDTIKPLHPLLVAGENTIAISAKRVGEGLTVDFGLEGGTVLARARGDRERSVPASRLAAQASFPRPGKYEVLAKVRAVAPPDHPDRHQIIELESDPLEVSIRKALAPELLLYAGDAERNVLAGTRPQVIASSEFGKGWEKGRAVDGLLGHGWLSSDGDMSPLIGFRLKRPLRANKLLLSHSRPSDGQRTARAWKVNVRVNGKGAGIDIEMLADDQRKTVVDFKKVLTIRTLDLTFLEVRDVRAGKRACGFAEVELQLSR